MELSTLNFPACGTSTFGVARWKCVPYISLVRHKRVWSGTMELGALNLPTCSKHDWSGTLELGALDLPTCSTSTFGVAQ